MMKAILSSLFGHKVLLSSLEALILNEVRVRLTGDAVVLWDRQVSSINKVQRLPDGVEINFYRMRGGRVHFDPALAFPNMTEELLFAEVSLRFASQQLNAKVWAVRGYLFSIEYSGGSRYFEELIGEDPQPVIDVNCKLLADISQPS